MMKKDILIQDMSPQDIQKKIEEYLPVRVEEKDKYGEVFTPIDLIEEMLDKLPKEVWKNPDLIWLDPANGIGNFPMIAYTHLMKGLEEWEHDKDKRSNHIIKNMLYMIELNPKNVGVSRKIFGKDANIYCGSFLEDEWQEGFPKQFDIIIGNPPFNKEKNEKQIGSRAKNSLWDAFVIRAMDIINLNGYLTFINPASWRGLGPGYHKIWDLLTKKQIIYLHIFGESKGQEFFKVRSRFDVYVLQNKPVFKETKIIDELGEKHKIRLDTLPFLPNYAYDLIFPLLTSKSQGINVIMNYSSYFAYKKNKKMSNIKSYEYKYPVVHSITKNGLSYWFTNDNTKGHFGVPKVILNFNEKQYSHPEQNDWEGKYGMSQISFGIPITSKEEGDLILKAIETDTFKTIIKATKWGAFQTDYRMFKYFKKDFWKTLLSNTS